MLQIMNRNMNLATSQPIRRRDDKGPATSSGPATGGPGPIKNYND